MKIQEVIDRVLTDSTGETRIAPTCDQLMTGDPQQEVDKCRYIGGNVEVIMGSPPKV